eukprot:m.277751 g.277751  ORF g.277751 m.277751 type:complete len:84 (-) comp90904_c0_seq1:29-280(-)
MVTAEMDKKGNMADFQIVGMTQRGTAVVKAITDVVCEKLGNSCTKNPYVVVALFGLVSTNYGLDMTTLSLADDAFEAGDAAFC